MEDSAAAGALGHVGFICCWNVDTERDAMTSSKTAILENMKKGDKFIGDLLAPLEQQLGMKFNKFDKPQDPKYQEPKKKNLRIKLKQAERKQAKLKKLDPTQSKEVHWQKAMDRAQGIKDKDDPTLIRKTIKKKQAKKQRSKKKWSERVEKQKNSKQRKPNNKLPLKNNKKSI